MKNNCVVKPALRGGLYVVFYDRGAMIGSWVYQPGQHEEMYVEIQKWCYDGWLPAHEGIRDL